MKQLIIIGIDGLSWNVIDNLIDQGNLKNIESIIKTGASGILNPDLPLLSPQIWASIFTGKNQERHGIKDFYSTKNDLKSDQIWDILSNFRVKVGIYRALTALSLKKVNDFFIPSFYSFDSECYPKKLTFIKSLDQKARFDKINLYIKIKIIWNLLKFGFPIIVLLKLIIKSILLEIRRNDSKERLYNFKSIEFLIHTNLFYKLNKKYKPEFSLFYENSCDTLSHFFWRDYLQKNKFSKVIPEIYKKIDSYIGKLHNYVIKFNSTLLIISDHGFKLVEKETPQLYQKSIKVLDLLRYLNLENDVYGTSLGNTVLFRIKPNSSITFKGMKNKIAKITCKGERIFIINEIGNILIVKLKFFIGNEEGLVIRLNEDTNVEAKSIVDFTSRKTGLHDENNGVFIISGPNISKRKKLGVIKPYDVTPTLLNILGVPIPEGLDGKVLSKIFKIEPKKKYFKDIKKDRIEERSLNREEEKIIKERLRSLGYID
ncbi:MAG: alkaline phosphatase family protein [Candidatus Thorarchaeota archaeon]